MDDVLKSICEIALKCGEIMKNADRSHISIEEKEGDANFVTGYDSMIQEVLKKDLKQLMPETGFIGEEGDSDVFSPRGKFFIVDPIDGTTNFIKDYHMSCVSVALIEDNEACIGVIYNPYLDEMFYAVKGKGAFLNGNPIHVSNKPLDRGIVVFGTATYYKEYNELTFKMAYDYFQKALDVRRSGSAALDLCTVASGRAERFFELQLQPWDFAAGALIVTEAGGIITTVDGGPISYDKPCSMMARNFD